MRVKAMVRIVGKNSLIVSGLSNSWHKVGAAKSKSICPQNPHVGSVARDCNAERTVRLYELVHPIRRLSGRRAVWIETGVGELLHPSLRGTRSEVRDA